MKILMCLSVIFIFVIVGIIFIAINALVINYDSIEVDEKSPFFNDEIEIEGTDKIKFKKK